MVTRCVAAGQPSLIAYASNFLNITTIFLEPRSEGRNGKEETTPVCKNEAAMFSLLIKE
jgi:hypothetical protein